MTLLKLSDCHCARCVASASSWPVFVAHELTAFCGGGGCGVVGIAKRYPQPHSRAGGRSGSGGQRIGIARTSRDVVVGEPVRAEEDGEAAGGIFVDTHLGAHEVRTQR